MIIVEKAVIMKASEMARAVKRMAHEVVEANKGVENLVLLALQNYGVNVTTLITGLGRTLFVGIPFNVIDAVRDGTFDRYLLRPFHPLKYLCFFLDFLLSNNLFKIWQNLLKLRFLLFHLLFLLFQQI